MASAVACGWFQYSRMMWGPATRTSPGSPGAQSEPAALTTRTEVWKNDLPVESGRTKAFSESIRQAGPQVSVRPYTCSTPMPKPSYRLISATGTGAAPVMIQRTLEKSKRWKFGTCSMKFIMAGTISPMVTRSCSISSQARTGSKVRITTEAAPR